jgi:uncharacterized damage-inducible protein DinB
MSVQMVRDLYAYQRWANRLLFDTARALGEEACSRDVGKQFSYPSLTRTFGHLYGADWIWLERWQGNTPTMLPGAEFASMATVRVRWDVLEADQRAFVDRLADVDLGRIVEYKNTRGEPFRAPLGVLLQHVANHATHHRSEIATMITMLNASPPDTGINTWELVRTGQQR